MKIVVSLVLAVSFLILCLYITTNRPPAFALTFSDAAKYADVARNLVEQQRYGSKFSFFGPSYFDSGGPLFFARGILPAMPLSIALFFKIFGISDFAVVTTSSTFYLLLVLFSFQLGKRLFGSLVGLVAALAIAFDTNVLNYATSGASEIMLMLEIVLAAYLLTFRKKWAVAFTILILVLSYFTRPQAIIYIAGFVLCWFLLKFKPRKALKYFLVTFFMGLLIDIFILGPLSWKYFIYSTASRGFNAATTYSSGQAISNTLRGGGDFAFSFSSLFKKTFYNLYNFYKLIPQILNPYLFTFFVLGLLKWNIGNFSSIKNNTAVAMKIATAFIFILTLFAFALTIPFFRYIHPVLPLIYLFGVEMLLWILKQTLKTWKAKSHKVALKRYVSRKKSLIFLSVILIFFFSLGHTLGLLFLDTRFTEKLLNKDKPPIYLRLSYIMKESTSKDDIVMTNLDTWGTWYGDRKTVWFALSPEDLKNKIPKSKKIDVIYLTSYLINDENYYMGSEWRGVFNNPYDSSKWDEYIKDNYLLKRTFKIDAEEVYENQDATAVLLVRKTD